MEVSMIPIDSELMRAVAPHFTGAEADRQSRVIAQTGPHLQSTLAGYDITGSLRIAYFLAVTCHESAGFQTTEEFASGQQYEGRADLGNTQRGDGRRYKGRGLLLLTGRPNYRGYGQALGVDLEGDPARAADPPVALRIACEYWKRHGLNTFCDNNDLLGMLGGTGRVIHGLADYEALLSRAKEVLGANATG
jgi:putative chitinase